MNDNGTGQSWLAKLPQALSKESLKVKSLLEFRSDSGLTSALASVLPLSILS